MSRQFLIIAAMSGLLLVLLGAFGAHALETRVPSTHLVWWQKAVSYQGIHTLALFGTALLALQHPSRSLRFAGWFFTAGILLFSGSLYLLALTGQRGLAMLTPLGGTAFIAGWLTLVLAAWRLPR
ncbi:MAG: DUF423 domain-containing protein [Candidatus Thiodiazotropha sp. (ex Codakia rugifera)]|nr:DUF423 domain-containing protein [Candidatus Thiodiazotropha sp. (ex Codakia rugifera)]